ncbi:metallophosphoesterase family protein [Candidatus Sulfurimonas marisnigri]|uniref:Phosphoesterase n=1 Tax=Candidatus Sulfurimonas marisnigri TaxID=2740405 RepID=A0A7S7RQD3_9BACT|nr:YfcE family phosphodiesterase [Candidatus Sulfurimonas marisnigri]QOY54566.1 metallophosphoesterase family protein [Candidatus Sulfurimonas marisnigri]
MKIGIISDTHSKVKKAEKALNILVRDGAEFIVHAGDIVELETLELLRDCGLKYVAVYGNNDAHLAQYHGDFNLVQEPYFFKIANTKFKLMHLPFYMSPDADVVIFGHTHTFDSDFKGNTLFLNSGEVCARSKSISEWAMLEVSKREFFVTHYTKANNSDNINQKQFKYKREHNE